MSAILKSAALELACNLINRASVTPQDGGCQEMLAERLAKLGFEAEWLMFGEVSNVIITHGETVSSSSSSSSHAISPSHVTTRSHATSRSQAPESSDSVAPSLWFLGHTDVVPSGPENDWSSPPFEAHIRDDRLYGRGAVDMKGAVAAMVIALETFVKANPDHPGQVGILLTSDEEGPASDGITRVADVLDARNGAPKFCLVGEPSCHTKLGDTVRIGRRGSIHARLKVFGVQGHSAFPDKLHNPIHQLAPFLGSLTALKWDEGDENFPPTHCQITNIQAGTGAENVTPGMAELWVNFRNSPASPSDVIKTKVESLLTQHGIDNFDIQWRISGEPFRSAPGALRAATLKAISAELTMEPDMNTGGGTSDGRFIAPLGTEVLEFGLINASIHQIDENTEIEHLDSLSRVYLHILKDLFK